jgi:hypothetical protein
MAGVIPTDLGRHTFGISIFHFLAAPFEKSIPQGAATTGIRQMHNIELFREVGFVVVARKLKRRLSLMAQCMLPQLQN